MAEQLDTRRQYKTDWEREKYHGDAEYRKAKIKAVAWKNKTPEQKAAQLEYIRRSRAKKRAALVAAGAMTTGK
jgi:hypothetical protein